MKKIFILLILTIVTFLCSCNFGSQVTQESLISAVDESIDVNYCFKGDSKMTSTNYKNVLLLSYKLTITGGDYKYFNDKNNDDNSIYISWEVLTDNLTLQTLKKKEVQKLGNKTETLLDANSSSIVTNFDENDDMLIAYINYGTDLDYFRLKATFTCHEFVYEKEYEGKITVSYEESFMYEKGYRNLNSDPGCYMYSYSYTNNYVTPSQTTHYTTKIDFVNETLTYIANGYYDYEITYHGKTKTITYEDYVLDFYGEPVTVTAFDHIYITKALEDLFFALKTYDAYMEIFDKTKLTPLYGTHYDSYESLIIKGR